MSVLYVKDSLNVSVCVCLCSRAQQCSGITCSPVEKGITSHDMQPVPSWWEINGVSDTALPLSFYK